MKIFKNLFGNGNKIHVDEIAVAPGLLLGEAVMVESGSNNDGSWVKYGDGTLICRGKRFFTGVSIDSPMGSVYFAGQYQMRMGNYPRPFTEAPEVFFEVFHDAPESYTFWHATHSPGTNIQLPPINLIRPLPITGLPVQIHFRAEGRWK